MKKIYIYLYILELSLDENVMFSAKHTLIVTDDPLFIKMNDKFNVFVA
jgi:hypothetical protein